MVSPVLLVIWVGLILYQIYKWMTYKPPNFPPGKYFDWNFFYDRISNYNTLLKY